MILKSYKVEQDISLINDKLILFYGQNLGLQNDFKIKIKLKNKDSIIINIDQEEILKNKDSFFSEVLNFSLFEKKKIFFINNTSDKIIAILEEIIPKVKENIFYLFAGLLDKKSKLRNHFERSGNTATIACYQDNEISIKQLILNKLKDFEGLNSQNLNIIINNSNLDRSKLYNELEKIILFFNNKKIESKKLESLLNINENNDFNNLKDEALSGNKVRTNKLISDTFFENEKNIFYLNVINQRLIKLLEISRIKKNDNLDDAINLITPPIFWKDRPIFNLQARMWSSIKIQKMLNETYKIETKIKSNSQISQGILIKKLLIDICCLANAS